MNVMEKQCTCKIRVTRHYEVVIETDDGTTCPDSRRQAARLQDMGLRVSLSIKGMDRNRR